MYVDGFVLAVRRPTGKPSAATPATAVFKDFGARPPMPFDGKRVIFGRFEAMVRA